MHIFPTGYGLRATTVVAAVLVGLLATGSTAGSSQPAVDPLDLGAATQFAILAGGGISDIGGSSISGAVGSFPLPAVADTLDATAGATVHRADALAREAQVDLAVASAAAEALTASGDLKTLGERTLAPGVYGVPVKAPALTGTLVLDGAGRADAVWIFWVTGDLETATASSVQLVNGAQACNVFWVVSGSVTLAPSSSFAGSVLAGTSVTLGHGVALEGRALAAAARVLLDRNAISVPGCAAVTAPGARFVTATAAPASTPGAQLVLASGLPAVGRPSGLPTYFTVALLVALAVAAALLGEPRRRRSPSHRGR